MLGIVPKEDQIGLSEIRFINNFSHPKSEPDCLGCYLQGQNGRDASIEIHLPNIIKNKISEFNFKRFPEVAALRLSHTIFHEIGHHVHNFKRHGVKKKKYEGFADKYMEACYYRYLKQRKSKVLASYKWASLNFFELDKEGRAKAREARQEIIDWLEKHKNGIPFP